VDGYNHRIPKFTGHGKFLTAVGQKGNKHLHTQVALLSITETERCMFVVAIITKLIQVLNADLTFSCNIGDACTVQLYTLMM